MRNCGTSCSAFANSPHEHSLVCFVDCSFNIFGTQDTIENMRVSLPPAKDPSDQARTRRAICTQVLQRFPYSERNGIIVRFGWRTVRQGVLQQLRLTPWSTSPYEQTVEKWFTAFRDEIAVVEVREVRRILLSLH